MYYLAYGSNLHPHRLRLRVPSARHVGNVAVPGMRLSFDKRSRDGSAKCMFAETGSANDVLYGAEYQRFPDVYVDRIKEFRSMQDADRVRVERIGQVLAAMRSQTIRS